MNERIRELQSKSYLMCKQIVDDDGHVVVTPDLWFDTFAELIVEECMNATRGAITGLDAFNNIKEHFGVE